MRARARLTGAVLAGALLAGMAVAPAIAEAGAVTPAATAGTCSGAQVLAWVGLGGRAGTARGVVVPLEFTNVGRGTCTLTGYPAVVPVGHRGLQIAPAAGRRPRTHPRRISLRPGQTAHALLTVAVARGACRVPVVTAAIRITPPGTPAGQRIGLVFRVCTHRRTLVVGPTVSGTGIP